MFMILTLAAFLFHLFGLNWFETHVKLPEPSEWVQKGVIAGLKVLELTFVYKMLTHKVFCCALYFQLSIQFWLGLFRYEFYKVQLTV